MTVNTIPKEQHNIEILKNLKTWQNKPTLQKIYLEFYKIISSRVQNEVKGKIVESWRVPPGRGTNKINSLSGSKIIRIAHENSSS